MPLAAGHSRAPSQKFVATQPDLSIKKNFDFIINEQIGSCIYVDICDTMRKMMATITSDPTPDSLLSALDSAFASIHCCDKVPADYSLQDVVLHVNWPARASSSLSRARSRSF